MKIEVRKPTQQEIEQFKQYPIWESPVTNFPWEYDTIETCLFIKGHVIVETPDGQSVEIKAGDLAQFPTGLKCIWKVLEPVRKHYKFE